VFVCESVVVCAPGSPDVTVAFAEVAGCSDEVVGSNELEVKPSCPVDEWLAARPLSPLPWESKVQAEVGIAAASTTRNPRQAAGARSERAMR
jgi:hypothetical protein